MVKFLFYLLLIYCLYVKAIRKQRRHIHILQPDTISNNKHEREASKLDKLVNKQPEPNKHEPFIGDNPILNNTKSFAEFQLMSWRARRASNNNENGDRNVDKQDLINAVSQPAIDDVIVVELVSLFFVE